MHDRLRGARNLNVDVRSGWPSVTPSMAGQIDRHAQFVGYYI